MTLGFPLALWLLALAALLLLAKPHRPARQVAVGTLFLWRQAAARDASTLAVRVRRNWLLVLQVLVVVAVVLALADPLLPWGQSRVAVVIDTSASMGATEASGEAGARATRLDLALRRAQAALDALPRSTRVVLWTAGASPARLGEYGARDPELRTRLRSIAPTSEGGALPAALRAADAADDIGSVSVFSDTARPERPAIPSTVDVRWTTVGHNAGNVAITTLASRWDDDARRGEILANIRNFGATAVQTSFQLSENGTTIARQAVALEPAGRTTVVVPVARASGLYTARIDLDDALRADNTRALQAAPVEPVRVALVGRNRFVERALAANRSLAIDAAAPGTSLVDVVRTAPRVLVCVDCGDVPDEASRVLRVRTGSTGTAENVPLAVASVGHPLTASLAEPGLRVVPVEGPDVSDDTVLATAGGWPVVVASDVDGRRVLELRLDLATSELTLAPAFPVLMAQGMTWLSESEPGAVLAGESIRWTTPAGLPPGTPTLEGPDGHAGAVSVTGRSLVVTATGVAGVYRVRAPGWQRSFVVNPVVDGESDLAVPPEQTAAAAEAPSLLTYPLELWRLLLLIALGLLGWEWWYRLRREGLA